jgi:hypothetical protein
MVTNIHARQKDAVVPEPSSFTDMNRRALWRLQPYEFAQSRHVIMGIERAVRAAVDIVPKRNFRAEINKRVAV